MRRNNCCFSELPLVYGRALLALAIGVAVHPACSSSHDAPTTLMACNAFCDKVAACGSGMPAFTLAECRAGCMNSADADSSAASCSPSDLVHINGCLDGSCSALAACLAMTSSCGTITGGIGGSSGTGGNSGTGGATAGVGGTVMTGTGGAAGMMMNGTGGSPGDAGVSCDLCSKADSCCQALGRSNCSLLGSCNASTGGGRTTLVQTCQQYLLGTAEIAGTPAACQ